MLGRSRTCWGSPSRPNLPGTIDEHPNWRRRLKAAGAGAVRGARRCAPGRTSSGAIADDSSANAAPAVPSRASTFADAEAWSLFRAGLTISTLAHRHPRGRARARYDVIDATARHPELARGRLGALSSALARSGMGIDPRHRAQPPGGRHGGTRGGPTCCAMAAATLRPVVRIDGTPRQGPVPILVVRSTRCCRPGVAQTRRRCVLLLLASLPAVEGGLERQHAAAWCAAPAIA